MAGGGTYLDLNLFVNGLMDAFLLLLTGRLLHYPTRRAGVLVACLLGGIPVVFAVTGPPILLSVSKAGVPFLMVRAAYGPLSLKSFSKAFAGFILVSAGLGGLIEALWSWAKFDGSPVGVTVALAVHNLWILPAGALIWWLGQTLWQHWQSESLRYEASIYDIQIDFGENGALLQVKALLDTGNSLRDPITGMPVVIVETEVAAAALPADLQEFLRLPWRTTGDPWPHLLTNPIWLKHLVFIPYKGLGGESWLLGIRPKGVFRQDGQNRIPLQATIALVDQVLSQERKYQALLHQDLVRKGADCT